jgi:hypothetical protein
LTTGWIVERCGGFQPLTLQVDRNVDGLISGTSENTGRAKDTRADDPGNEK